ncbi:hypothetical protein DOQ87_24120 [Salmonella enterica subsp. enterica serovar Benin]|nr:hypothetical protein [Salmonella enterica subsp. enterica serovar Benin]EBW4219241.1 hypothetical protein [Salmonella enterica subsp. enterica serovar Benin]ECE9228143.1 hypothetical protein [Salmonella enterica subsp. enterica serovar Benin]OZU10006.1 hypothetical protein CCO48_24715 [Salmonella enterica subsp. enterica serovar Altendorf]
MALLFQEAVKLRLRKIRRSLAQDIVIAPQFMVLALRFFKTLTFTGGKSIITILFMLTESGVKSISITSFFGQSI